MKTCKYCEDKFDNTEDLQMHEINCKCNPYYRMRTIDKNNFVYPLNKRRIKNYDKIQISKN